MFNLIVPVFVFICVHAALHEYAVDGLECYTCTNVTSLVNCSTLSQCPSGSICYNENIVIQGERYFTLGCKAMSACQHISTSGPATSGPGTVVGRSTVLGNCSECCQEGLCNRQLCQHDYPSCADNTDYDCILFGAVTNLCLDTSHVKHLCKRFCGLCSLVDGVWSAWSAWSACGVSCENGTMARSRDCNTPVPANGGESCLGISAEVKPCSKNSKCPVNGDWTPWAAWSSCSASCDIGLQRRQRECTNPKPSFGGDDCRGVLHEEKICFPGACADGHWSSWGQWSSCTVTCDVGLVSRSRNCDNPAPSLTGKSCTGDQKQTVICNNKQCAGGQTGTVAFKARYVANVSIPWARGQRLVFQTVLLNEGSGYDRTTGYFTAPRNGTYLLTVQVCTNVNKFFEVFIMAKGSKVGTANHAESAFTGTCVSGSGIAILSKGDQAWIESFSTGTTFIYEDLESWNSFSGVLIGS